MVRGRWSLLKQGTEFTDAAAFYREVCTKGMENTRVGEEKDLLADHSYSRTSDSAEKNRVLKMRKCQRRKV